MWTRYSDEQRASALAALKANNGNVNKTAREIGIPEPTLRTWSLREDAYPVPHELQEQKNGELTVELKTLAHALLRSALDKSDDKNANIQQVVTSLGIVIDKLNLLEGGATSRVDLNVRNLPEIPDTTIAAILTD